MSHISRISAWLIVMWEIRVVMYCWNKSALGNQSKKSSTKYWRQSYFYKSWSALFFQLLSCI